VGNKEIIGAYGSNCPLIFIFSPLFVLLIIAVCYEEEEVQKRITFERENIAAAAVMTSFAAQKEEKACIQIEHVIFVLT
jgi:hypothetical protein